MKKTLFKRLVESMKQHDEIARGLAPSRQFTVDVPNSHLIELQYRLADYQANPTATEPARDVLVRLENKLKR